MFFEPKLNDNKYLSPLQIISSSIKSKNIFDWFTSAFGATRMFLLLDWVGFETTKLLLFLATNEMSLGVTKRWWFKGPVGDFFTN
jgi:hypothetical protein